MDAAKSDDNFDRIALHHEIERSREVIASYLKGMAFYHDKIEQAQYELGRLEERLDR